MPNRESTHKQRVHLRELSTATTTTLSSLPFLYRLSIFFFLSLYIHNIDPIINHLHTPPSSTPLVFVVSAFSISMMSRSHKVRLPKSKLNAPRGALQQQSKLKSTTFNLLNENTKLKSESEASKLRIELFFKTKEDLKGRIQLLSKYGISSFNLVNKSRQDTMEEWVDTILQQFDTDNLENTTEKGNHSICSICAHYSLKFNKAVSRKGRDDASYNKFISFLQSSPMMVTTTPIDPNNENDDSNANNDDNNDGEYKNKGLREVLLISGSGEKAKLDPINVLQRLQKDETLKQHNGNPTIAVAYNPFFPSLHDQQIERDRLEQKLKTKQVHKIYLQFGTDLEILQSTLKWLTSESFQDQYHIHTPNNQENDPIAICGSIFLPTKKLIAQQKFRPWNGVFLNQEFLNSNDVDNNAYNIVVRMMKLYQKYNCEIIIEAPGIRTEKDLLLLEQLLNDRDDDDDDETDHNGDDSSDDTDGTRSRNHYDEISTTNTSTGEKRSLPVKRSRSTIARSTNSDDNTTINNNVKKRNKTPSKLVSNKDITKPAILLFGSHDMRVHDNEAFQCASCHNQVIPTFLWDKEGNMKEKVVIGALEILLKDALRNLKSKMQNHGLDLICRNVSSLSTATSTATGCDDCDSDYTTRIGKELLSLCNETGAGVVYWNEEHTTESHRRESKIKKILQQNNIIVVPCQSSLLYDPKCLKLSGGFSGGHWGTLMPFLKACKKQLGQPRRPRPRHETFAFLEAMEGPQRWPNGVDVEELDFGIVNGKDKWHLPILERFPMSEEHALNEMETFMNNGFYLYEKERSRADLEHSTSKLSPHLRLGTLSPNELYYKVEDSTLTYDEKKTFSRRLIWRDLAYFHLLNFPNMRYMSIRGHYEYTEWVSGEEEKKRFHAWKSGTTGYPLVDAGMRELYKTGWLTQSLRMVVASFLTEYLRVNWVKGCEWFHYTLVDADSAINPMMWQNAGRRYVKRR